jgi:hypothetical protein
MQKITSDGRMIDKIACGSNFTMCSGISTGLTVLDEQRQALEDKITELQETQSQNGN